MATSPEPAALVLDGRADTALLGGKAAALDRLIGWGVPVPPTGVVTAAAYRRVAAQHAVRRVIVRIRDGAELGVEEIDRVFAAARLTAEDARALGEVAGRIAGGRRVAVRSSATVEDLAHSSFAGQYRSTLDVDPADPIELESAVLAVFASLWHPAPRAYRQAFGIDDATAAMAVVIMPMVAAQRAGVVFTVDPAGTPDAARIEVVDGTADSLVSGAETPDAAVLLRTGSRSGADPVLVEALDLALGVEATAGVAQDIEWAWDGERVWIVQARPITVVEDEGDPFDDDPLEIAELDLTTLGIGEMLPGVLSPLVWGLSSHLVEDAFRRLLDELGVLPDALVDSTGVVRRVHGRAAMDFGLLHEMASSLPGSAADELEDEYFGSRRRGRRASVSAPGSHGRVRAAAHDLRVLRARRAAAAEAATMVCSVAGLADDAPDPADLDTPDLLSYHARLVDLAARTMAAELGVAAYAATTHRRLQVLLAPYLDETDAGHETERLVAEVGVTMDIPSSASAAVFAGPTWEELGLTPPAGRGRRDGKGSDDREAASIEHVLDRLRESPQWKEDSLLTLLRRRAIRRFAHETPDRLRLREQSKAALLVLGGMVRRLHLEAGRRLVEAGMLGEPADVDLLTPAELRSALREGATLLPDELARRRRRLTRWSQEGALPARFTGRPESVPVADLDGDRLDGWAASRGRFRGRATVVDTPTGELEPGSVLVAEATDPSWSPLFMKAGAIVLDRGGPLSHAAILARELGVPAVLNVPGATSLLAGREVTVDGDAGVILLHDAAPDHPHGNEVRP